MPGATVLDPLPRAPRPQEPVTQVRSSTRCRGCPVAQEMVGQSVDDRSLDRLGMTGGRFERMRIELKIGSRN